MDDKQDIMAIISLLAGAAQSGATGVLAQAALNLTKATEVKQRAEQLADDDDRKVRAEQLFQTTRDLFLELANDKSAIEEGKKDILATNATPYQP